MQRLRKTYAVPGQPAAVRRSAGGTVEERVTVTVCTDTKAHRAAFRQALAVLGLHCTCWVPRPGGTSRAVHVRHALARRILKRYHRTGRAVSRPRALALDRMLRQRGEPAPVEEFGRVALSNRECKKRGLPRGSTTAPFSCSYTVWGDRPGLEALARLPMVLGVQWATGTVPYPYKANDLGSHPSARPAAGEKPHSPLAPPVDPGMLNSHRRGAVRATAPLPSETRPVTGMWDGRRL